MSVLGVDVSNNNGGAIAWQRVAGAGYEFALIKASEGTSFVDQDFAHNWRDAKAAGLVVGAYHFARPSQNAAAAEAQAFLAVLANIGGLQAGDLVALDIETGVGDLRQWVIDWLQAVEAAVGCKPLLYTGAWFAGPHDLEDDPTISQYGLWLAAWQATIPAPLSGWGVLAVWQNGVAHGTVPGVPGDCDLDVFNGTIDQLRLYGAPEPPPVDPRDQQIQQLLTLVASTTAERDAAYARLQGGLDLLPVLTAKLQGVAS